MRVLVMNWRDIENPNAGGAEIFTHELLKRLAERGHEPTLFTSAFDGCDREEVMDGVNVVRSGGRLTVYRKAKKYYRRRFRGEFDVVVDEINTRPFMTPKYVDEPVVALIHQLAREIWFYETSFPVDRLGYHWLEDRWLRRYTDVPTLTVSESTKQDLVNIHFEDVTVVPQGLSFEPVDELPEKADVPTFSFVGRMNSAKRPDHAVKAFEYIKRRFSDAKLHMVGDGELLDDLRQEADEGVTIHGYAPEAEKLEMMKRSHALLVPSVREGWGLVVTEAAAMGTPAVGYDVPGLRDSIVDGRTGLLSASDPGSLAASAISLFDDYDTYAKNALENAREYDWEATTDKVEHQLREVVR
ncbi:glycosyltransferase family 4 protein [Halostella sp. JP-L12]|uniref:glycosyltransferase family 4 protein n=1 Tax=Halostella TaxID=1843185 RepID=UPI000EF77B9F|nr:MULTISPECIES: glycosyltransferase family 4 protein [Halostella]NHN46543.1 glycosyltransferase family 4 protein [Halostella sp. JP-L12]